MKDKLKKNRLTKFHLEAEKPNKKSHLSYTFELHRMFEKLLESKRKGILKTYLSINEKSEEFPLFLEEGDEYLSYNLYLDHDNPTFAYPTGPVADALTLYSFAAKQAVRCFIPNKENESEFLLDFYSLLKVFEVKPEQLDLDPLVINLRLDPEPGPLDNKNYFTNTKKLFFNFEKSPEDVFYYAFDHDKNRIFFAKVEEFLNFSANQDYNRSLILINLLQQQFYANHEKIKRSLPPQVKRLVIISSTDFNKHESVEETHEFKNLLVYDSSKTLEEIFIEEPWFHRNEPYKIV